MSGRPKLLTSDVAEQIVLWVEMGCTPTSLPALPVSRGGASGVDKVKGSGR